MEIIRCPYCGGHVILEIEANKPEVPPITIADACDSTDNNYFSDDTTSKYTDAITYVIKTDAYYKIGCTTNIAQRIQSLKNGCPTEITLLFTIDKNVETELHRMFASKRIRGEWFALDDNDIDSIKAKYPTRSA